MHFPFKPSQHRFRVPYVSTLGLAYMDTTIRRLRRIRDVAGSVAVGTVGGSVAAVSTVLPSQGGAIGASLARVRRAKNNPFRAI